MAWTTPRENWTAEVLTAAAMNAIGADLSYLKTTIDALAANVAAQVQVPLGAIMDWPYAANNIPTWAQLPAGQQISRTTYSGLNALASAAGYPHGAGDGSTTFTLPDLRGRVLCALDNMGGTVAGRITAAISGAAGTTLGAVFGSEGFGLVTAQLPAHNHTTMGGTISTNGTNMYAGDGGGALYTRSSGTGLYSSDGGGGTTYAASAGTYIGDGAGAHSHHIYAARAGGGYGLAVLANFKENVGVAWATGGIDVSFDVSVGGHNHTISDPTHRHSFSDPGHRHYMDDPGHTHTITGLTPATVGTGTLNAGPATTAVKTLSPMMLVNKFMRAL